VAKNQPFPPGYVCPTTGRVAVLVRDYANSDLNGDATAYWFSVDVEEFGFDTWSLVEGVDLHTQGDSMDVCYANGSSKTVGPLMTFFVCAADASRLAAEKITDFSG
jgi:hypothetical protein